MDWDKVFGTVKEAEENGSWIKVRDTDFEVKLARITLPAYEDAIEKNKREYINAIREGTVTNAQTREMTDFTRKAIVKYILLDWKNLEREGKDVKYSKEEAYKLLCQDEFYNEILDLAEMHENFTKEYIESSAKN